MRNIVITGANKGIGLELVKAYLAQGDSVFAVCRKASDDLSSTKATIISGVDVAKAEAMDVLKGAMGDTKIDVLINNAGVFRNEVFGEVDYANILLQFEINALGPLRITEALSKNLKAGAKVGLITSRMGSIADNGSGAYYGYRMSKAALNAAGVSLARDLQKRDIAVAILHPGFVQTEMVGFNGDISPQTAAERIQKRMDELTQANSGTFWHSSGEVLPW